MTDQAHPKTQLVRSALYLDFDNLFGGLFQTDPDSALELVRRPDLWVERLAARHQLDGPRRWLMLRCYMNPAGSVPDPSESGRRLYFSKYRPDFVKAGFEVIDCPSLTSRLKNAADIRMVIDVLDALSSSTRYDEFVLASNDADFTPLMLRLRAADRRTTILTVGPTAPAYGVVPDQQLNGEHLVGLLKDTARQSFPEVTVDESDVLLRATIGLSDLTATNSDEGWLTFANIIREMYLSAAEPLNLAASGSLVQKAVEASPGTTRWYGHGSFKRALMAMGTAGQLPGLEIGTHYFWDRARHNPPRAAEQRSRMQNLPDAAQRSTLLVGFPAWTTDEWTRISQLVAELKPDEMLEYTRMFRHVRDHYQEAGEETPRRADIDYVTGSLRVAGATSDGWTSPTADDVRGAVFRHTIDLLRTASADLAESEAHELGQHLGVTTPGAPEHGAERMSALNGPLLPHLAHADDAAVPEVAPAPESLGDARDASR